MQKNVVGVLSRKFRILSIFFSFAGRILGYLGKFDHLSLVYKFSQLGLRFCRQHPRWATWLISWQILCDKRTGSLHNSAHSLKDVGRSREEAHSLLSRSHWKCTPKQGSLSSTAVQSNFWTAASTRKMKLLIRAGKMETSRYTEGNWKRCNPNFVFSGMGAGEKRNLQKIVW